MTKQKRIFACLLAFVLIFSLCACGTANEPQAQDEPVAEETAMPEAVEEVAEPEAETVPAEQTEPEQETQEPEQADAVADSVDLTGVWVSSDIDFTDSFAEGFSIGAGDDAEALRSHIEFTPFLVRYEMTLSEDGTALLVVDKEQWEVAIDQMIADVTKGMRSYMEAQVETSCANAGITMEDFFKMYEVDNFDAYLEKTLGMSMEQYMQQAMPKDYLMSAGDEFSLEATYTFDGDVLKVEDAEFQYDAENDLLVGTNEELGEFVFSRK